MEACVSRKYRKRVPGDPIGLERGVRQRLADKVSGNLAGIWLLVAEHLRLGTWDLLCGWTRQPTCRIEPRLAMQLVHEAAVCTRGIRAERTLHDRGGFELANGLPFVATDQEIHHLLNARTVADTMALQVGLGKIRRNLGDLQGRLLAIDPHRMISYTKRQTRKRIENRYDSRPVKMAQTFWVLDADTHQPVCFTTGTAAQSVLDATPALIDLAQTILQPSAGQTLVAADAEHFSGALISDLHRRAGVDLVVPLPGRQSHRKAMADIPQEAFTRRWAGFATAKLPIKIKTRHPGTYHQFVARYGERPDEWRFKGFLSTSDRDEVETLTRDYPMRWHVEEFFNANQALGWQRAGTTNLNIRYGQMTMALIAQAAIYRLRQRLGTPYDQWDADHLAKDLFHALEADVRVTHDTIIVTYYNAPRGLHTHYSDLPSRLARENIKPTIPWLYDYKLDFRFR